MEAAGRPTTKPSTRRLSEVASQLVIPEGIMTTGWPAVSSLCADWGVRFEGWQDGLGRVMLGKRDDGIYAATVGGVVISIPRQVGKTFFVGMALIAMCVLFPGLKVVWTAHHMRTATNTFTSMQGMVKRRKVWPHIARIRQANGEQEIHFSNGSVLMFGARAQGFGRGFDEVDVEVFDEAQILNEKALADMVPATNQARHPHGALVFYMGTPPRPSDPSEAFASRRKAALSGKSRNMVYVECSADEGADVDDRKQWAKANPSFPHRTPEASMLRMRENLASDDDWRREGLGLWDKFYETSHIFDLETWGSLASDAIPDRPDVIGFAVSVDQAWASVAAVASVARTPYLGAVVKRRQLRDVAIEAARISREYGVDVAVDGRGPASRFVSLIEDEGGRVLVLSTSDYLDACADLTERVSSRRVRHGDHVELNDAVMVATVRDVGDRFAWKRRGGDISMLEAATCALWASSEMPSYELLESVL